MSDHTEWTVEPRRQGWLGRLIAPREGERPSSLALGVGGLGAAAFVASLALDWQRVTIRPPQGGVGTPADTPAVFTGGLGAIETLSLVYVLGVVALLALLGAVARRPRLALGLRMATMGAGAGILAVLIALTVRMPRTFFGTQGLLDAIYGGFTAAVQNRIDNSYEPGIFFGYAAVILPMIGVWLAGRPAARAGDEVSALSAPEEAGVPDEGETVATRSRRSPRSDSHLDLTVTPDGPRST